MSHQQLPPYLGSWEELVKALLHNPFLGSGAGGPQRLAERQSMSAGFPNPDDTTVSHHPPRPNEFTSLLLAQISLRQAATRLSKEQGNEVIARIDQTVADEIDFICGNGIPVIVGFHPPPPPPPYWTFSAVVSELTLIANTMQEGGLRNEVERVAGVLLEAGLKNAQVAPARVQERKVAA